MALAELEVFPKQASHGRGSVTASVHAAMHDGRRNSVDQRKVPETGLRVSSAQDHDFDSESTTKYSMKPAADPELKQRKSMLEIYDTNGSGTIVAATVALSVENRKNTIPENSNSRSSYNRRQGETVLSDEERESRLRPTTDLRAAKSNMFLEMLLESI